MSGGLTAKDKLKNLQLMWNGACMLIRDLIDSVETAPGRCIGGLFWCLERHIMDHLIFLIFLLLIMLLESDSLCVRGMLQIVAEME
jgi:hypothetical protein